MITDLNRDTLPYNPNRPDYFSMQTENNPSKRDSRDFEKAQSVINRGTTDKPNSIHKESPHRNRKYTQRGTNKPNPKKSPLLGIYATVHKGNPRMIRDCSVQQPANARLYSRLFRRETHE